VTPPVKSTAPNQSKVTMACTNVSRCTRCSLTTKGAATRPRPQKGILSQNSQRQSAFANAPPMMCQLSHIYHLAIPTYKRTDDQADRRRQLNCSCPLCSLCKREDVCKNDLGKTSNRTSPNALNGSSRKHRRHVLRDRAKIRSHREQEGTRHEYCPSTESVATVLSQWLNHAVWQEVGSTDPESLYAICPDGFGNHLRSSRQRKSLEGEHGWFLQGVPGQ